VFLLVLASASLVLTSCSGSAGEASNQGSRRAQLGSAAKRVQQMPAGLRPAWTRAQQPGGSPADAFEAKAGAFRVHHGPATPGSPQRGAAFDATLDDRGVELEAGKHKVQLSLAAMGRHGALDAVQEVQPVGEKNRVRYRHGGVVETWVHGPLGLEQFFDLAERPAGAGDLVVQLELGGALSPRLEPGGERIALVGGDGAAKLYYGELYAVDAHGARVPAKLGVSEGRIELSLDDRRATYPLHIDPLLWAQQAKLTSPGGAVDDGFGGKAVSLSGDTALIGAGRVHGSQGSAYVFVRSGTTWTMQQELAASDGAALDKFGDAVSLSGDTALIGALMSNPDALLSPRGSAYVFVRSGTTWAEQAKLAASDGAALDKFGDAVSLSGDTALIGAKASATTLGSAYVFVRSGTTWAEQAKLTTSDEKAGDQFGWAVSLSGDTALVGMTPLDVPGSAYVFVRSGTTWAEQAKLTASDGAKGAGFGLAVSIDGDVALVGAQGDTVGGNASQGSAYVFVRSGTTWAEQAKLTASDGDLNDLFGSAVSLVGDTALVGAATDTVGGKPYQGSVYVFVRSGTSWTQQQHITGPSGGEQVEKFGDPVSLSGDTALFGAAVSVGPNAQGAAYVFQAGPGGGAAGAGGAGAGGAGAGGAGTGGGPAAPGSSPGGCGCHLSGSPARPARLVWLLGLAALGLRRRERASARA